MSKVQEEKDSLLHELTTNKNHISKLTSVVEKCRCNNLKDRKMFSHSSNNTDNDGIELDNIYEKIPSPKSEKPTPKSQTKTTSELTISTSIKPSVKLNSGNKVHSIKKFLRLESIGKKITSIPTSEIKSERKSTKNSGRYSTKNSGKNSEGILATDPQDSIFDHKRNSTKNSVLNSAKNSAKHSGKNSSKQKKIKTTHYMDIVKYQTVESDTHPHNFREEDYDVQNTIEDYNSNKTIETNIDEYDIDYNHNKNYDVDFEQCEFNKKKEKHYNYKSEGSDISKSRSLSELGDDDNKPNLGNYMNNFGGENSIFGTNLSKYYQKLNGKDLKDYAHETDNTEKDILLDDLNSPIFKRKITFPKVGEDEINLDDKYKENTSFNKHSVDYEYSYAQTNEVQNNNVLDDKNTGVHQHHKPSMFSTVSMIDDDKMADISLGSINDAFNNINKNTLFTEDKPLENIDGDNFISNIKNKSISVDNYSDEDYNPK